MLGCWHSFYLFCWLRLFRQKLVKYSRQNMVAISRRQQRSISLPTPTRWHGPRRFICTLKVPNPSWGMRDFCGSTKVIRSRRSRRLSGRLSMEVPDKAENRWKYTGAAGQRIVLWPAAPFLFVLNQLPGPKIGKNTEKTAKIFQNAKRPIKCDVSKDKRVIFTKITCKPIFTRNRSQMYSF